MSTPDVCLFVIAKVTMNTATNVINSPSEVTEVSAATSRNLACRKAAAVAVAARAPMVAYQKIPNFRAKYHMIIKRMTQPSP
jgi:hypothetical protein